MSQNIEVLVLSNGQAVVGEVVGYQEEVITMKNVMTFHGSNLTNYCPYSEENTFDFRRNDIRHAGLKPISPVLDTYNQAHGAGIQIVNGVLNESR